MNDAEVRRLLARSVVFLEQFAGLFGRRSRRELSRQYIRGLLNETPRKSMQPMVEALTSTAEYQSLQHFITNAPWDGEALWKRLRKLAPEGPSILLIDDTGFPKQGTHSVGVARQYSGTLGKVGNCQVAVGCVLVQQGQRRSWPMGFDLYLPEDWAKDPGRRERAEIPRSMRFLPKWRIALRQIDRARREGPIVDAVVADAGYGEVFEFRKELRKRRLRYMVGIKETVSVRRDGREDRQCVSVSSLAASLPRGAWKIVRWRNGTKGPLRARFAAVRVKCKHGWTKTGPWPPTEWLLCERSLKRGERKRYYLSNLPPTTALKRLVSVAHTRWQVEDHFQRLKEEIGIDHFEGRSWIGWHHHTALAAVTYALLESERIRRSAGKKTFQWVRAFVRKIIFLMMGSEKNEDVELLISFRRRPPPGWGLG